MTGPLRGEREWAPLCHGGEADERLAPTFPISDSNQKQLSLKVITPLTFGLFGLTIHREHELFFLLANLGALGRFDPRITVGAQEEDFQI